MRSDHWEIHFHPKQMLFAWFTRVKVQVKESHYKTRQILRVPGGWSFQISRQSAQEGAKVSPTHRPPLPPGNIPGTVRGWLSLWAILRPEGLCQWKIPVTPSGIELATFRLVAQCLSQLSHRMPLICNSVNIKLTYPVDYETSTIF